MWQTIWEGAITQLCRVTTPTYFSPQLTKGTAQYKNCTMRYNTQADDIYAMGISLHKIITGIHEPVKSDAVLSQWVSQEVHDASLNTVSTERKDRPTAKTLHERFVKLADIDMPGNPDEAKEQFDQNSTPKNTK